VCYGPGPSLSDARKKFLYYTSRPALRAACGRPPARQPHGGHRGTGLTLVIRRHGTTPPDEISLGLSGAPAKFACAPPKSSWHCKYDR